jgi:hypothetical protein
MTPQEFAEKMRDLLNKVEEDVRNVENCHYEADELLGTVLSELGYDEGIRIFDSMEKWYA